MFKKYPKRCKNESSKNFKLRLLFILTIALSISAGCIFQNPKIMKVNPVIDSPLGGYTGQSEGKFMVLEGNISEVKEGLYDIIVKKASQPSSFSIDDNLNLIVFRGVFSTGGYGIRIDKVERLGNVVTVHATYINPGKGIGNTAAFTQPTAIIPIERLDAGEYEARLKVTMAIDNVDEITVIEPEKQLNVFNFKVKNRGD